MPISRKKGESAAACMRRAMHENTKKHPYKQAIAISMSQCGISNKDNKDWEFFFMPIYADKVKIEHVITCKKCNNEVDYNMWDETKKGWIKCPFCDTLLNKEGENE